MITQDTKATLPNKAIYVNELFSKIAKKYDLLNSLMTFGFNYKWKEEAIKLALSEINNPTAALDICCGTCDLGIILSKTSSSINITCTDNCSKMLEIGRIKIEKLKLKNITLSLLDSEDLLSYFPKCSFDIVSIGFGLRNLVNKEKCIEDIYKLLHKNGVFVCIDLGHPTNYFWQKIFFYYFFKIVPTLGAIFAKNKEAYTYLPHSLVSWYTQEKLKNILLSKGFKKCYFKNILGGVVAIHIAIK